MTEDDDSNIHRAEHSKLMGFLEKPALALQKGNGTVAIIFDRFDFDLSPTH